MRTNYVLVDFENVQPASLEALGHDHFKLLVFIGASQAKVPYETAASLQQLGARAGCVKITGNGSNALDFHIAYYIGKLAATEPTAYFHVVSKDTGFDPLIQHLKSEGIFAGRVKTIAEIPLVKASAARTPSERNQVAANWLQQTKATKPRTVKTLRSTIASMFKKQLPDEDVATIVHWQQSKANWRSLEPKFHIQHAVMFDPSLKLSPNWMARRPASSGVPAHLAFAGRHTTQSVPA